MTRLRLGRAFIVAALTLCGLLAVLAARPADAVRYDGPLVAVGDAGFTAHPVSPAFTADTLDPGRSVSAVLGVRTTATEAGQVTVRLDGADVTTPFAKALVWTVAVRAGRDGPFHEVWRGDVSEFEQSIDTGTSVVAGTDRWLRVTVAMPWSAGNAVARQRYPFTLVVALTSTAGVDAVRVGPRPRGVDAAHAHHGTDAAHPHRGTDAARQSRLAATGPAGVVLVTVALAALSTGIAPVRVARRRPDKSIQRG